MLKRFKILLIKKLKALKILGLIGKKTLQATIFFLLGSNFNPYIKNTTLEKLKEFCNLCWEEENFGSVVKFLENFLTSSILLEKLEK